MTSFNSPDFVSLIILVPNFGLLSISACGMGKKFMLVRYKIR